MAGSVTSSRRHSSSSSVACMPACHQLKSLRQISGLMVAQAPPSHQRSSGATDVSREMSAGVNHSGFSRYATAMSPKAVW